MRRHAMPAPPVTAGALLLACALAGPFAGGPAQAGELSVNPVRATLTPQTLIVALSVRNAGDMPATMQLDAVAWSQADGKDVHTATQELLATPPIFTVPPGGTQMVRVGLRRPMTAPRELSYRLYLQEIPSAASSGAPALQVSMRIGVPVFVPPRGEA